MPQEAPRESTGQTDFYRSELVRRFPLEIVGIKCISAKINHITNWIFSIRIETSTIQISPPLLSLPPPLPPKCALDYKILLNKNN